ncbi:hypothetical protein JOC59_000589 [Weissella beninensis]|uniref:Uncharacterized protein n=1 Tax=Periweissella beninensis TaxID=504936 RepID=A0ABT0VIL6_9LACO|nr:hypothetical protein [Periweissella beninensis]MBM7543885.1 hypothetical protein [Periweissella beninensis]MCM2436734.1 hypothetical protein [Periweissella beninensis]
MQKKVANILAIVMITCVAFSFIWILRPTTSLFASQNVEKLTKQGNVLTTKRVLLGKTTTKGVVIGYAKATPHWRKKANYQVKQMMTSNGQATLVTANIPANVKKASRLVKVADKTVLTYRQIKYVPALNHYYQKIVTKSKIKATYLIVTYK